MFPGSYETETLRLFCELLLETAPFSVGVTES